MWNKHWNNFKIISVFYFTRDHVWNWNKVISAAEIISKLFRQKWTYWKHSRAAISFWNNSEIISGKFPRAEIKLFQTDVDEGWNNFDKILFHM